MQGLTRIGTLIIYLINNLNMINYFVIILIAFSVKLSEAEALAEYKLNFFKEQATKGDEVTYFFKNIGQGLYSFIRSKQNPNDIYIYDAGSSFYKHIPDIKKELKDIKNDIICKRNNRIKVIFSHGHFDHYSLVHSLFDTKCIDNIESLAFIIGMFILMQKT